MIIKGGARCDSAFYAKHLMRTDTNERVSIAEIRGLAARDVREALREMDAIASGTHAKNGFYVASLNPSEGETLTAEQWEKASDRLERELGLDGQARFIVEHEKNGRTHRHVVWSRIDVDTMTAIPADFNYQKHEIAARAIEQEFGLAPVESVLVKDRGTERPERRAKDWEDFRATDTGIDPNAMKAEITVLWQAADNGAAFKAALEEHGYFLARGDRRDFCIVDQAADEHSLARRISGANVAEIRERLADIERGALPSVAEARELARNAAGGADADAATGTPRDVQTAIEAVSAADELSAATRDELARQIGDAAQLSADTDKELAARFGDDFAAKLKKAQQGELLPDDVMELGTTGRDLLPADVTDITPEHFPKPSWWREKLEAARESALQFLKDETSGTPEAERGPWTRMFDAGRKLFGGLKHHDAFALEEGLKESVDLVEALAPHHDKHVPILYAERHRDPPRPGANVDASEPDDKPQEGAEEALEPMSARELAENLEYFGPEYDAPILDEPEPDDDPEMQKDIEPEV